LCRSLSLGLALALLLGSLPRPAAPYDRIRVTPGVEVEQIYDSNVFNVESSPDADLATIVSPSIEIALENDRTYLDLRYELRSSHYVDYSDLNAIDHRFRLTGSRQLTRRLSLFGVGTFTHLPKSDDVDEGDVVLKRGRVDLTAYRASGGFRYTIDRLSSLTTSLLWAETDQEPDPDRTGLRYDVESLSGSLAYRRTLSARDSIGLQFSRRETTFSPDPDTFEIPNIALGVSPPDCPPGFEPSGEICLGTFSIDVPENKSTSNSLNASWSRIWNPRWNSSLVLGATRVDSEQGSESFDPSFTFVGSVSVSRQTRSSSFDLSYSRSTRPSSSAGTEVDVDSVRLEIQRSLARRLGAKLTATWTQARSASDQNSTFETETSNVVGTLDWRWTERFSTFMRLGFRHQSGQANRVSSPKEFDKFRGVVGFQYSRPIDLY
jgi:hypothetical protein